MNAIVRQPWLLTGRNARAPSLSLNFLTPGVLDPRLTFARASVGTYFDVTGAIRTAANDTPRWDYDPVTHALKGMLVEDVGTNLLLNSAALNTQSVTVTAVATTLSFYGTGSIAYSGAASGTLVGTGSARASVTFTPTAGTLTCTVTGQVLNAQLEVVGTATSWIPTTGTAATRAVETLSMPTGAWFNPAQSTISGEYIVPAVSVPGSRTVVAVSDGTNSNRLVVYGLIAGSAFAGTDTNVNTAGVVSASTVATVSANVVSKVAGSFDGATQSVCLNGTALVSAAMATPGNLNFLWIGARQSGSVRMGGWVRRVQYWPRALSGTELQAATT